MENGTDRRECARLRNPRLITFREARFGDLQIQIADSGAVAIMPSGRLAARIGSGSARFLSCQLVGSLGMGGCRRRGGLPGLLRTGMATGVSSAGLRRLAGSGVRGLGDVGRIWPRWPGA